MLAEHRQAIMNQVRARLAGQECRNQQRATKRREKLKAHLDRKRNGTARTYETGQTQRARNLAAIRAMNAAAEYSVDQKARWSNVDTEERRRYIPIPEPPLPRNPYE